MGVCYEIEQNISEAKKHFINANRTGFYDPECRLGQIYYKDKQYRSAANYFENVLKHASDNKTALARLAVIYLYNRDGSGNMNKGKEYLIRAAQAGDAKSMYNLGLSYAKFKGVNWPVFEYSRKDAVHWLKKAQAAGIYAAAEKLKQIGE